MRLVRALILLFGVVGLDVHADVLWQNTEYGMTPEQVLEKYPEAFRPDQASSLMDGAQELLRLPPIELAGEQFTPKFFFEDNKLVQVMLQLIPPSSLSEARATYHNLVEALTAKYGQPLTKEDRNDEVMTRFRATWMSGRTNISMLYLDFGRGKPVLNLNYQGRLASDADKL